MVKQLNDIERDIPEWLKAYRYPMEKSRAWFHHQVNELPLTEGAAWKYDAEGKAKPFQGLSLVTFLHPQSDVSQNLKAAMERIRQDYQDAEIDDSFAFLPPDTWHITIADLIITDDRHIQNHVVEHITQGFEKLQKEHLAAPQFYLRSDMVVSAGTSVVSLAEPKDEQSLRVIQRIRRMIAGEFEPPYISVTPHNADNFIGHVTGWYFRKALDTQRYSRFKEIMLRYDLDWESLGEVFIKRIELRRFTSMEAWGKRPLAELIFAPNS